MSTKAWAQELLNYAVTALNDAGVPEVVGTLDLAEAASALVAGQLVVCPRPPTLEIPTWHEVAATWELVLIAGPHHHPMTAWERLDEALMPLLEPLAVEGARPDAFLDNQSQSWPALVLTTTSTHTL